MRYACQLCRQLSNDGNHWCPEPLCPAMSMTVILSDGQTVDDMRITKLVRVLPTSTLYLAERNKRQVFLKMAHTEPDCVNTLKREANLLYKAEPAIKPEQLALPRLQPGASNSRGIAGASDIYSKITIEGELKYFEVLDYIEGNFLSDILIRDPQPWLIYIGQVMFALIRTMQYLHEQKLGWHLNLNPDSIIVRTDADGLPRPYLLDLGYAGVSGVALSGGSMAPTIENSTLWLSKYGRAGYIAPELIDTRNTKPDLRGFPNEQVDIYGVGMLLYEMLQGQPAFPSQLKKREEILQAVVRDRPSVTRTDLVPDITKITLDCISPNPAQRPHWNDLLKAYDPRENKKPYLEVLPRERTPYERSLDRFKLTPRRIVTIFLIIVLLTLFALFLMAALRR